MKKAGKILTLALCLSLGCVTFASCGSNEDSGNNTTKYITTAIAREAGSGTRGAFDELVKSANGEVLADAPSFAVTVITGNSTGAVFASVAQSDNMLGYVSLGNVAANASTVKSVKVENVEATNENITNGSYKLSRPFNLVYQNYDDLSDLAKNFISFIESDEGQSTVNENYIACAEKVETYVPYTGTATTLKLGGSTSMEELMKSLAQAFMKLNRGVTVTVEGGGSGTGIAQAGKGFEIGLASRDLKSSESGVTARKIADDGIAVIVKKEVALTNVTLDQLYSLYVNGTKIECK